MTTIALRVLHGEIQPEEGRERLRPYASSDNRSNPSYFNWKKPSGVEVRLAVADVRSALEEYLKDAWSEGRLQDWAWFLTMSSLYMTPEPPPEDEDWYDDIWDLLYDLSCPIVFGPINKEGVRNALERLLKYD